MTYTLAQYGKLEKNELRKGVLFGLALEGIIADLFKWRRQDALNVTGVRYDAVPTPAFIPLDGTIAEATVDGHQITHSVYRMAHHMDIPVPLSVELGRTKMPIKNLLQLAQGSVVELSGLAGEPLDVLINGFLIAQGEVVVINEKLGIRVTDIITPSERLRRLSR